MDKVREGDRWRGNKQTPCSTNRENPTQNCRFRVDSNKMNFMSCNVHRCRARTIIVKGLKCERKSNLTTNSYRSIPTPSSERRSNIRKWLRDPQLREWKLMGKQTPHLHKVAHAWKPPLARVLPIPIPGKQLIDSLNTSWVSCCIPRWKRTGKQDPLGPCKSTLSPALASSSEAGVSPEQAGRPVVEPVRWMQTSVSCTRCPRRSAAPFLARVRGVSLSTSM